MVKNTLIMLFDHGCLDASSTESLCIAKKVNGLFNAVFHNAAPMPKFGQKKLMARNTFNFTTEYQVYFALGCENDALITSATDTKDIAPGQYVEWKDNDLTEAAIAGVELLSADKAKNSFAVKNVPKDFHVAIKASTGTSWTTIFVDPINRREDGETITLSPTNEYLLYFYDLADTEYIHEVFQLDGFKFSFPPGDSTRTIRYGYRTQDEPEDGNEEPAFHIVN